MAEPTDRATVTLDEDAAVRLQAIAVRLSLAGITTHLYRNCGIPDLTATMRLPGHREVDVIVDEDGYTELRYWADPVATPAEVAYAITSALAAITPNLASSADAASRRMPGRASGPITGYDGAVTECAGDGSMPGPPDQLTEPGQSPESVRLRESGPVDAELRQRMEQLRPGHPSSPYKGDGSPKPPVPDPFKNELPIPGDPGYQPDTPSEPQADLATDELSDGAEAADAGPKNSRTDLSLDAEDKPRVDPDGSWEWKGFPLTSEESHLGDYGIAKCRDAEGRDGEGNYGERGLTPAMRHIEALLEHGELVAGTEEFALKGADRFKLKLAERVSAQPGESADALLSRIHDGIRYTFVYDDQDYTTGVAETEAALGEGGYELTTRKPSWDGPDYKGVNSQWRDPDSGLFFEVQFHTHASWDAKQTTHRAYERLTDPGTTADERKRLDEYQKEITASVPVPPGALEIPYYHKKGT